MAASAQYYYVPYTNAGINPGNLNKDAEYPQKKTWLRIYYDETKRIPNHLSARQDGAWDTHRRHGNESKTPFINGNKDLLYPNPLLFISHESTVTPRNGTYHSV